MKRLARSVFTTAMFLLPTAATAVAEAPPSFQIVVNRADGQVQIQTTGDVTFDLSSEAIFDLHDNGTLLVIEHKAGHTKQLSAQGSSVVFQVDGINKPYDDAAKAWLRGVLAAAPPPPPPPPAP